MDIDKTPSPGKPGVLYKAFKRGPELHDPNFLKRADYYASKAETILSQSFCSTPDLQKILFLTDKALRNVPFHIRASTARGGALYFLDRLLDAEHILASIIETGGATPETHRYMGLTALERMKQGFVQQFYVAKNSFLHMLDSGHDIAFTYNRLAFIYSIIGDNQQADKYFTAAINAAPDDYTAHLEFGVFLEETGDPDRSEHYLKEALQIAHTKSPSAAISVLGAMRHLYMKYQFDADADQCSNEIIRLAEEAGQHDTVEETLDFLFTLRSKREDWALGTREAEPS